MFSLLLVVSTMSPFSVQAQDVTPQDALLNVISGLKEIESFKGEYNGTMNMLYEEGTVDFTTEGDIQFKITPELQFGFSNHTAMDAAHNDGSTENETYDYMAYLVDQTMYLFQDDSAEDTDGEWVTEDISTMLGMETQQISAQYQMLVSILEGAIRSYYIPSRVNELLSEKTTVEANGDGHTITIHSFETEEEWLDFFEALEELEQSTTESSGVEIETELDELEAQAKALAAGLTYTITVEVDANDFITSINVIIDSDVQELEAASETESDTETPQAVQAVFNYNVTANNFEEAIEIPAEVPVN